MTWLVQCVLSWEFLAVKELREGVHAVVLVVDIDDVDCVISQVVVDDELLAAFGVEFQDFSIVLQELLLTLQHRLLQLRLPIVIGLKVRLISLFLELISRPLLILRLRHSIYLIELSRVLITAIEHDAFSEHIKLLLDHQIIDVKPFSTSV